MLTKKQIQRFKKLQQKKYRSSEGLFVAEGQKCIEGFVAAGYAIDALFSTLEAPRWEAQTIALRQMEQLTFLKNSSPYFGVFQLPKVQKVPPKGWVVALDSVADPGNLGTIIRLCDWFGVKKIYCSPQTVDCFNPKVVQACMGSLGRVECLYTDLVDFLQATNFRVLGAVLDGSPLPEMAIPKEGVLLMGSESHGISSDLLSRLDHRVTIPKYDPENPIDSLNVATALGIFLAQLRM